MGRASSANGGNERFIPGNLREGDHLEDRGIEGKIILKWLLRELGRRGMDWIDLGSGCGLM